MFENYKTWLMLSLTLGLAPFFEKDGITGDMVFQPHVWGKLKWIIGGANGMQLIDWGDFFMHGIPWIGLIVALLLNLKERLSNEN